MRTVIVAAAALLAGLFLGRLPARMELARVKKDLDDARAEIASGGGGSSLPLALGLGGLLGARERAMGPGGRLPPPRFDVRPPRPDEAEPAAPGARDAGADARRRKGMFGNETFAAAKAAADLRASQYRAAFLEQAHLSPDKEATFNDNIKKMNDDFGKATDDMAALLREKGRKATPRDLADVGARLLDVYRKTDDQFRAGLDPAGQGAADRTRFDLLTQIDLGSFQKLAETMESAGFAEPERAR